MVAYLARRAGYMVVTVLLVSIVAFTLIQLPPGDFVTTMINELEAQGTVVDTELAENLRAQYGLDRPVYVQYFRWIGGIVSDGDFGYSFAYLRPVSVLIWERFALTVSVTLTAMVFTWIVAIPIGILSAVKQYSVFDYIATVLGFLGLAIPNFMFALVLMWFAFDFFGVNVTGLFSPEFQNAPWSFAKFLNFLSHVWVPMVIIGTAGTAGLIRTLRANLLDELRKPYVTTARSKGIKFSRVLMRYPVRIALNPFVSALGLQFPTLISGVAITAIVLNLPTLGPLLLSSLQAQDMYLAGSIVLLMSVLTVVGVLVSDLLLGALDPRIRLQQRASQ
ncbi:MAG: ABC transporter permease [Spirochaetota bacterium]